MSEKNSIELIQDMLIEVLSIKHDGWEKPNIVLPLGRTKADGSISRSVLINFNSRKVAFKLNIEEL